MGSIPIHPRQFLNTKLSSTGRIATHGDDVVTVEIDGKIGQVSITATDGEPIGELGSSQT